MVKQLFTIILLLASMKGFSQSITGLGGNLFIPTAYMHEDKTLILGSSYFDRDFLEYGGYQFHAVTGYASLTFLPFAELSFRFTRQLRKIKRERDNSPDRMPSARIRILKERKYIPAIAVGVYDFSSVIGGGARHFASSFLVASKSFDIEKFTIQSHGGYGLSVFAASNRDLEGVFAGFSFAHSAAKWLQVGIEYDSRNFNAGIKLLLWKRLQVLGMMRDLRRFEGGVSWRTKVP